MVPRHHHQAGSVRLHTQCLLMTQIIS
jgi:hypothetical protein